MSPEKAYELSQLAIIAEAETGSQELTTKMPDPVTTIQIELTKSVHQTWQQHSPGPYYPASSYKDGDGYYYEYPDYVIDIDDSEEECDIEVAQPLDTTLWLRELADTDFDSLTVEQLRRMHESIKALLATLPPEESEDKPKRRKFLLD